MYHFTEENDCDSCLDDCEYPNNLPNFLVVKKLLITKYHVIMSMYWINLGGTWKYRDQILSAKGESKEQIESILRPDEVLPQGVSTLPILGLHNI